MKPFRFIKYHILKLYRKGVKFYRYCDRGVWNDTSHKWNVNITKTLSLAVKSFTDKKLQQKSAALTYHTVLAIVPALAMLFAIGRGFGFQNLIEGQLFRFFPAQREALQNATEFVDSYMSQASQGAFVGIGIVILLWTLISLMSNVEDSFNSIWGVRKGRTLYRKVTDYTALFLLIPILMVISAGISIFMSNTVQSAMQVRFISPLLDYLPIVISWFVFAVAFWVIPNTKVKLKYALISGILCGTAFFIVQMLFMKGQIYVTKYNAIYGTFAFLPLMLIWLYLSWLIALSGVALTFASQNIYNYNYTHNIKAISPRYLDEMCLSILAIIVKRFERQEEPCTRETFIKYYHIPVLLTNRVIDRLSDAKLIVAVNTRAERVEAYQPAFSVEKMTVNSVRECLNKNGKSRFIPEVDSQFKEIASSLDNLRIVQHAAADTPIKDLLPKDD